MNKKKYVLFYIISLLGTVAVSAYPLYMGIRTADIMICRGAVPIEEYPKYIIPYTPIAIALILGVLLMPLFRRLAKKFDLLCGSVLALAVFLFAERIFETKILVQTVEKVSLESWQMALCYVPPEQFESRTWEAVDVLLGGYSPAFNLHFYLISALIIISALNCIYGFSNMIRTGEDKRKKMLIIQSAATAAFIGMCIWACFTSFYRTGEMTVPTVSAWLMSVFFVLMGMTAGVYVGSFTLNKNRFLSVILPALTASSVSIAMYIGELILLSGNLYRFGSGFMFDGLGALVLAPADLLVIIAAGLLTALICVLLRCGKDRQ